MVEKLAAVRHPSSCGLVPNRKPIKESEHNRKLGGTTWLAADAGRLLGGPACAAAQLDAQVALPLSGGLAHEGCRLIHLGPDRLALCVDAIAARATDSRPNCAACRSTRGEPAAPADDRTEWNRETESEDGRHNTNSG